jgi:hypothetical protein
MKIRLKQLKKLIGEAERPRQQNVGFIHYRRASSHIDEAVSQMEQLALARPDLEHVVNDAIDAVQRAQDTLDRLGIVDDRFEK